MFRSLHGFMDTDGRNLAVVVGVVTGVEHGGGCRDSVHLARRIITVKSFFLKLLKVKKEAQNQPGEVKPITRSVSIKVGLFLTKIPADLNDPDSFSFPFESMKINYILNLRFQVFKISRDKLGENGELKEVYQRELQVFVYIVDTYNKDLSPLSIDFSVFDFYFVK